VLVVASAKSGDVTGRVWFLDLRTLQPRFPDVNAGGSVLAPLATDGTIVYVVNDKSIVLALDATQRGKEVWRASGSS
jgi:hypothetical protein